MTRSMKPRTTRAPCRLFVITARSAPLAVILRRGPSDWYHLILWNTRTDAFTNGAWIRGRIYEEKCDLSSDGKLFLYFILQGNRHRTSYTHAWTAVSRPPWSTALALWPQGTTYGGGGRFTGDRSLTVRTYDPPQAHPDHPPRGLKVRSGNPDCRVSASIDHDGRLIHVRAGRLYRRTAFAETEIADFNSLSPAPMRAPAWAYQWPD